MEHIRYRACGLSIDADSPVPGLRPVAADGLADLHLSMRGHPALPRAEGHSSIWYTSPERDAAGDPLLVVSRDRAGEWFRFEYLEGARFEISADGCCIDTTWADPLTRADAATFLLGPVLAFTMRLRGTVPLHASAVAVGSGAALFVGPAGAGKSTTAAACARLDMPVLADDLVALREDAGTVLACPSHPRVSVWEDSARALFDAATLPVLSASYEKLYLDLLDRGLRFQDSPMPVDVIYVLRERDAAMPEAGVRPLSARAAFIALVANTYGNYLLDSSMRTRELEVLTRVVDSASTYDLTYGTLAHVTGFCERLARPLSGWNDHE